MDTFWKGATGGPSTGLAVAGFARVVLRVPHGKPLAGYSVGGSGHGAWTRNPLCARAMYLRGADGSAVLLAVVDLMSASRYLHERAASLTQARLGLGADRLILCGTHTHTAPGGFYGNSLYDVFASHDPLAGFDRALADGLAEGIASACVRAVEEATPATVRVDVARVWGVSRNRSLAAFQRNEDHLLWTSLPEMPGYLPPPGLNVEQQAVDPRVVVLSVYDERQARIGAFATFACHSTANGPRPAHGEHPYYDPDWPGAAARQAERDPDGAPVVMVALSGAGDQTALPPATGGVLRGPVAMGPERAEWVGAEVARAIASTNRRGAAGARPPEVRLRAMRWWTTAHPDGDPKWNSLPEAPLAPWCFGASTLAGSEEGRSAFFPELAHEGMTSPTSFPPSSVQHPKARALGLLQDIFREVASLRPSPVHALNLLRVNDHVFATVPGEPTAWAAHQIERALVNDAGAAAPSTPVTASVIGYAGDYAGYFTTRDEFRAQHYEGASTLFGLASTDHLIERLRAMARVEVAAPAPPAAPIAFDDAPRPRAPASTASRPDVYAHAEGSRVVAAWVARADAEDGDDRPTARELLDQGAPGVLDAALVHYAVKDLRAWRFDDPVHVAVARVEGTTTGRAFALRRGRAEVEVRGEAPVEAPARAPAAARAPPTPARFSAVIATWNSFGVPQVRTGSLLTLSSIYPARFGSGDLRRALDGFDVLCVQELIGDEARAFFDGLSPYPTRKRVGAAPCDDHGLGIATRLPVEGARSMHFAERGVGADRLIAKGALHVRVRLHRGPAVDVVTTHLQAGGEPDRVAVRTRQLDELAAFVRALSDPSRPMVVCGDFNVDGGVLGHGEYELLARTMGREGLVDLDAGARMATVHPGRNDLLRQLEPRAKPERLDYVFWRGASVDPFAVGASRVALVAANALVDLRAQWEAVTGLEGEAYASDHFGLRVELSYVPSEVGVPEARRAQAVAAPRGPVAALPVVEETTTLRVGETRVRLVRRTWGPGGVVHLNVHDNENTSVEAAEVVLSRRGGTLIELRHGGGRRVSFKLNGKSFDFDPNRVFTDLGAAATVKPRGSKRAVAAARAFGEALLAAFDLGSQTTLVALHNNTPEAPLTVTSYASGRYKSDAAAVTVAPGVDPDDFFYVTTRAAYERIAAQGFHVVLQDNEAVADDGSLSVDRGRRGIRYVNVEAQHGHLDAQVRMLEAALDVLAHGA